MLTPELTRDYPNLASDGGKKESEKTPRYNCIAWAAAWDDQRWWQPETLEPGMYWPPGVPDDGSIQCFIALFEGLRYKRTSPNDIGFSIFFEKVAIYESDSGDFTHVVRQTHTGIWWSKLGEDEDVYHSTPFGVESKDYGKAKHIMKRRCTLRETLVRMFFKIRRSVRCLWA